MAGVPFGNLNNLMSSATSEAGFGGPATTQGSLTQGNKTRESKDQLHEAISQIIEP